MKLAVQQAQALDKLCHRYHVRRLQLFGSAARETDFESDSDIDLLVEFEQAHEPPLSEMVKLRDELASVLGRNIDLATTSILNNPFRRQAIERDLEELYAA